MVVSRSKAWACRLSIDLGLLCCGSCCPGILPSTCLYESLACGS